MHNYSLAKRSNMLWVPKDEVENIEYIKRALTITPRYKDIAEISVYSEEGEWFGFPRNYLNGFHVDTLIDETTPGLSCDIQFIKKLRDYQVPVAEKFMAKIRDGKTDIVMIADTGFGKTITLLWLAAQLKRTTLILVPKTDLMDSWIEKILEFTNVKRSEIGIARQDKCEYIGKKFVIGMIHSVCKDKYPEEFKRYFGVYFVDEAQRVSAFHFSRTAGMFPAKYRIAVTAELKRGDGMEEVAIQHFGSNRVVAGEQTQPVPKVVLLHNSIDVGQLPHWLKTVIQKRGALLSLLANSARRNKLLLGIIEDVLLSKRQTLVISERIPQLEALRNGLIRKGYEPKKLGLYLGRTSDKERTRVAEECDCIFATTKMVDIGTDIPTLRALVFATPLAEIKQPVGRIRRINEGLADPVVIDVFDTAYPETRRWLEKRRRFYNEIKSEIVERRL